MVYIIFRDDTPYKAYLDHALRDEKLEQFIHEDKEQEYTWSTLAVDLETR